ncbi:hypothetical protein [Anaeromyxobacter dehalogenans]|uniref:Uncharacterized protein n=1 Tax=Anaeromyxobacter dehalogenans (strain 2CP-C) TaxID=290397 RepID=Q2IEE8_ANADE|nr:hypothetical protein [Anaeromyxobacter dehalogenans]ABC82953.1 hypothetical protein Adeh_3185 [Anaeromyxobacter dehalogenans 2CP-C]
MPGAQFHDTRAADGRTPAGWTEHQVRTTVDFARSSRVLAWSLGGLSFQIEHLRAVGAPAPA